MLHATGMEDAFWLDACQFNTLLYTFVGHFMLMERKRVHAKTETSLILA